MKTQIGSEIETINSFFLSKREQCLKQGQLLITVNAHNTPLIEIHFKDGTHEVFMTYTELFKSYHIGTLPFFEKDYNVVQKLIKKLFKI